MRGKRLAGLDFCFGMSHVGAYGIYVTTLFLEMDLQSSWVGGKWRGGEGIFIII